MDRTLVIDRPTSDNKIINFIRKYPVDIAIIGFLSILFAYSIVHLRSISETLITFGDINSSFSNDIFIFGSISAAMLHMSLMGFAIYAIGKIWRVKMNGTSMMGILLCVAFSIMGKTLIAIPFAFGINWIMAKIKKTEVSGYYWSSLFSLALSPAFMFLWTNESLGIMGKVFAAGLMMLVSALMPAIGILTARLHDGYTLANGAASAGIMAFMINGIFIALSLVGHDGKYPVLGGTNNEDLWTDIIVILITTSTFFALLGYLVNDKKRKFTALQFQESGKLPTDYVSKYGFTNAMYNSFLTTMAVVAVTLLFRYFGSPIRFSSVLIAAIIQVIAFSTFGKTLRPMVAIVSSAMVAWLLFPHVNDLYDFSAAFAFALFATLLCPIITLGYVLLFLAGFMHMALLPIISRAHGGLLLYGNGLTSLFTATIIIGISSTFKGTVDKFAKAKKGTSMVSDEKLKSINIITELMFHILNNKLRAPKIKYEFHHNETILKLFVKDDEKESFTEIVSILNSTERDLAHEVEFWTMLGKDPETVDIELLGKMVDIALIEGIGPGKSVVIIRRAIS